MLILNRIQRTYVYIDGFNLYYRGLKNTPHKWLDLKTLSKTILDETHKIEGIKYFTATVSGKTDLHKPLNQQIYIRALEKHIPEISVHYGHFLSNIAWAMLANSTDKQEFVKITKTEEKGSDVNLAIHLLNDAWLDKYDCAVIISNDSDIAEAMNLVKQQHQKKIGLLLPPNCNPSKTLMRIANFVKTIRKSALVTSQLPDPIQGTNIHKPTKWKIETELDRKNISYANLVITNLEKRSQEKQEILFTFRYKKTRFSGQANLEKNKLDIEKIEKIL